MQAARLTASQAAVVHPLALAGAHLAETLLVEVHLLASHLHRPTPIPKTAGITRHRPIRTTNIATAVQQDNDTKGMLIRIPFSQRKSSQVDKARRNRCRKGIKMVTGLFDKNGKPVDIGDRTRLISEDGSIREFEVCFKTLQGTTGEGVDVSLTGVFFCEDGQDYLPRVDKNGVSDMEKMEVISKKRTQRVF